MGIQGIGSAGQYPTTISAAPATQQPQTAQQSLIDQLKQLLEQLQFFLKGSAVGGASSGAQQLLKPGARANAGASGSTGSTGASQSTSGAAQAGQHGVRQLHRGHRHNHGLHRGIPRGQAPGQRPDFPTKAGEKPGGLVPGKDIPIPAKGNPTQSTTKPVPLPGGVPGVDFFPKGWDNVDPTTTNGANGGSATDPDSSGIDDGSGVIVGPGGEGFSPPGPIFGDTPSAPGVLKVSSGAGEEEWKLDGNSLVHPDGTRSGLTKIDQIRTDGKEAFNLKIASGQADTPDFEFGLLIDPTTRVISAYEAPELYKVGNDIGSGGPNTLLVHAFNGDQSWKLSGDLNAVAEKVKAQNANPLPPSADEPSTTWGTTLTTASGAKLDVNPFDVTDDGYIQFSAFIEFDSKTGALREQQSFGGNGTPPSAGGLGDNGSFFLNFEVNAKTGEARPFSGLRLPDPNTTVAVPGDATLLPPSAG